MATHREWRLWGDAFSFFRMRGYDLNESAYRADRWELRRRNARAAKTIRGETMVKLNDGKPLRTKRCENCACYDGEGRECHAGLPICIPMPTPTGQLSAASIFPPMRPEGWCRKWEPEIN